MERRVAGGCRLDALKQTVHCASQVYGKVHVPVNDMCSETQEIRTPMELI